jgi:predicted ArsR family transcriptional regulator
VKFAAGSAPVDGVYPDGRAGETRGPDRTRDAVVRIVLERGPQNAATLAVTLGLSQAGVRRHLDALCVDGVLAACEPRPPVRRGRGRPARTFAITDAGRAAFPHGYDDLATTALRYLRETGGDDAVLAFAEHRAESLAQLLGADVRAATAASSRADALAESLTSHGYAASTESSLGGVQVCQHHCPVAHVAAEFPQLCEAETRAFERVLGTYVQRLATIAHGDGVCTTHVPVPPSAATRPPIAAHREMSRTTTQSGRT